MFFRLRQDPERTDNWRGTSLSGTGRFETDRSRSGETAGTRPADRSGTGYGLIPFLRALLRDLAPAGSGQAERLSAGNDWRMLCEVAKVAEVSEFDLFRAAWTDWHGTRADEAETSGSFGACLNGAALPAHVRHFVRRLHSAVHDPALAFDRERFGLDRLRRVERLPDLF